MSPEHYLCDPALLRMRSGEDRNIEKEAAAWLAKCREGVTALRDKRDFLTKDQYENRTDHEVLNQNGIPDESLIRGSFRRAYNPLAGQRPSRWSRGDD